MKKRLHSIICLLLVMLLTASCGSGTSADTTASEQDTLTAAPKMDRIAELGDHDFGGEAFVILDAGADVNVNTPDDTLTGDLINDTIVRRNEIISELYNVSFEYVKIPNANERANMLRSSVMANEAAYDLLFAHLPDCIAPLATEGILADLCAIEPLSLDANWWSPLVYESLQLGGKMYYSTGDISPISYRSPACYYANETLLDKYGISKDGIYSYVENGTWTLDVLKEYTKDLDIDLNEDGTMYTDDDFFGVLNEDNTLTAACFMVAAGVNLSAIDGSGSLTADLGSEQVIHVIEKLKGILSNAKRSGNPALHAAFMEDRAVFVMHYAASGYTRYRGLESDYLTLPLPKYDEKQETYRSLMSSWGNAFVCVPVTADADRAGVIMEAMAYWSHDNLRSAAYDVALKEKGSRNEKDAMMLDILFNTLYLDFNSFMEFGGSLTPAANALFKDEAYASAYESIREKMNAEMEEFAKAWIG